MDGVIGIYSLLFKLRPVKVFEDVGDVWGEGG